MPEAGPAIPQSVVSARITEAPLPRSSPVLRVENSSSSPPLEAGLFGPKVAVAPENSAVPSRLESNQPAQKSENKSSAPPQRENSEKPDSYKILGLDKNATPEQVRQAFRSLAKGCHPDLHPDNPDAEERFKEINNAWDILKDPEKRALYDTQNQEKLNRAVTTAEGINNIMSDKAKAAFVDAGCREITALSPDGKSKSLAELTPRQLEQYAPSIIAATAEKMLASFSVENPDTDIKLMTVIPDGEAMGIRALLEAGSKKEAYMLALIMLLMAIISALQMIQARIAQDQKSEGAAFDNLLDYSQAVGTMLGHLKGAPDIKSVIHNLLHRPAKQQVNTPQPQAIHSETPVTNRVETNPPQTAPQLSPPAENSPPQLQPFTELTPEEKQAKVAAAMFVATAVHPTTVPAPVPRPA